ncbi:hypothetical protein [Komagataeibacter sp. FNDCR2]|uniref:hypothetical protein n=1 Tax=Komagataeibacter sp. FNDCR2 TaxID=2878682 RepID=UPI001E3D7A1D|nr:hypothetical protein [Komagataeibacter sp. FNDCR2]MCE2574942.1 hypothetical protein [Komagataeibacter sp. FNDCR2]
MHDPGCGAPGDEGLVFDAYVAILHEFAAALRGIGLARGALFGLAGLGAPGIARRGFTLAQPFKGLPEC